MSVYTCPASVPVGTSVITFRTKRALVATLPQVIFKRVIHRIALSGPTFSNALIYLGAISDANQYDNTIFGEANTADYPRPIDLPAGANLYVVWYRDNVDLALTDTGIATFYQDVA